MTIDIATAKRHLVDRAQAVAEYLFPAGHLENRDWCVGSISGEAGASLKICVSGAKTGVWTDFAAGGEQGGDLIDLWMARQGVSLREALEQIRSWLGIEAPRFEKPSRTYRRPDRPKGGKPASAVLTYLIVDRKLSRDAITRYRIGEDGRTILLCAFLPDGVLASVKYLGIDRPGGKKQIRVEADCEPVLYGWQAIDPNSREITITEGEIDALAMYDYGRAAVSVPFGGGKGAKQQWIEVEFDRLAQFETIYLALDMDDSGNIAAEEIANRLGRHRCRRVRLPHKDANACLVAGVSRADIDAAFDRAENLDPPELRRAGEYTDDVINLFWPAGGVEPGYRLPFSKFRDRMVFRAGELTIWTGASGSGKSVMLGYGCVAWGDQGARICIASLEMAPKQTLRRMVKQAGNVDRPTEPYIREITNWLDRFLWVFAVVGKSNTKRILEIFEYARARYGCDVFVIDSLMRLGIGSEDYEGQERAVFDIVSWAVEKNVHVHLVAHARKADRKIGGASETEDIKGASEIGSNAFNILAVWRNKAEEERLKQLEENGEPDAGDGAPPVLLNVAKQRNGDWDGKIGLWFDRATYQYRDSGGRRDGVKFITRTPDSEWSDDP